MSPRFIDPINENDHLLGSITSSISLIEYGDYQCTTCKLFIPIIKRLQKEIGSSLCYAYRHFPLKKIHSYAQEAAIAAEAASLQNKFWEMHELLFSKQLEMEPHLFVSLAEQLNLDCEKFKNDCTSPQIIKEIEEEFKKGVLSGVNLTPCFYING